MKRALTQSAVALAVAFFVAVLLTAAVFEGQVTGFFRIGDALPLAPLLEAGTVRQVEGEVGYDGQFFLTLALDPFLHDEGSVAALDNPRYRSRRILYPLLGRLLGFGSPALIPFALVGINVLCIALLVLWVSLSPGSGEASAPGGGRLPLLVLAVPGVWISLVLSTADLLAVTLLVGALVSARRRQRMLSALLLAAACLTKEVFLGVAAVLVVVRLREGKGRDALAAATAALPALLWIVLVSLRLPAGTSGVAENLGPPLFGVAQKVQVLSAAGLSRLNLLEALSFGALTAAALLLVLSLPGAPKSHRLFYAAALPSLGLFTLSRLQVLGFYLDYLRVFTDLFLLNILTAGEGPLVRSKRAVLLVSGAGIAAYALYFMSS